MVHLHSFIDAMRAGNVYVPGGKICDLFPKQKSWILNEAIDAVCFNIGSADFLPKTSAIELPENAPYPVTWFEFKVENGIFAVIASQNGAGLFNLTVLGLSVAGDWSCYGVFDVDKNQGGNIGTIANFSTNDENASVCNEIAQYSISVVIKFLQVLSCSNVSKIETPAPKLINKKRTAKGKSPIFSYWTLHIHEASRQGGQSQGGSHSSPRVHLRRGHIRRCASGVTTWVQSCVVGSKEAGVVSKDYALKPRRAP